MLKLIHSNGHVGIVEVKDDLRFTKQFLGSGQRRWILQNVSAQLTDLRAYLEQVSDEFYRFDDDALLRDHIDELSELTTDYVNDWGPLVCECTGEPHTFAYRRDNVDEDLGYVEELIQEIGESYLAFGCGSSRKR